MTTTCLINNYNYAQFVGKAVESALDQSTPFDEVIVVDDGSTDDSLSLLKRRYAMHPSVQIVAKPNQGQLSCFNAGFARATGDVVFFLDADDLYEPHYLAEALAVYQRDPHCDFVFCGHRQFGQRESLKLASTHDRDLGYSVILTACLREWIGAPTSCLSMRRSVLERILPLPFAEQWRTRADDCLVFGASLVGARKYYLAQPLVRYRVHDSNQFCGKKPDKLATYRRRLAINALFDHLERKQCYNIERLAELQHREFRTIARPTFRQWKKYARIGVASRGSIFMRLARIAEMTAYYVQTALQSETRPAIQQSTQGSDLGPPLLVFPPPGEAANAERVSPHQQRRAA